jgi:TATA-binding protein-associated factor Taf7
MNLGNQKLEEEYKERIQHLETSLEESLDQLSSATNTISHLESELSQMTTDCQTLKKRLEIT